MAVEEVNVPTHPGAGNPTNQVKVNPPAPDAAFWAAKTAESKNRLEYIENQRAIESMTNPAPAPEPAFKVSGEFNMGKIDFQQQMKESQEKTERLLEEQRKKEDELRKMVADAEKEKNRMQFDIITKSFEDKFTTLQQAVVNNQVKPRSFIEQFEELQQMAGKIGLSPARESTGVDPNFSLEMLKLQQQQAREEREWKRSIRNDEKNWTLQIQKLAEEREAHKQLLAEQKEARIAAAEQEKNKAEMWGNSLKSVGAAIASAYIENAGDAAATISGAPKSAPLVYRSEAGVGEVGQLPCPKCGTPIGVGPTSEAVMCVKCGTKVEIDRIPQEPTAGPQVVQSGPEPEPMHPRAPLGNLVPPEE